MLKYKIKVKGYAAERDNFRQEVVITKTYGIQTETEKTDEYKHNEGQSETHVKEKVETSKKKKAVTALPQTNEEIIHIIQEEAPLRIAGMFKQISKNIRGDTKTWRPPKGRYGITNQLQYWTIDLDNININNVKRSQFLQLHGNFNSKGSTLEYGDSVDFDADMSVWTPALDHDNTQPVIEKIIRLSRLTKFGPFRHARILFAEG